MKTYPIVDMRGDSYLNPVWSSHKRSTNGITKIAIHHDAVVRPHSYDSIARYRSEAAEHYKRLGPGLQYHYKIDNVGNIYQMRDHTTWLYAIGTAENVSTIHICIDGYFQAPNNQNPTREQYEALSQLLIKLCDSTPSIPASYKDVWAHRSFKSTACCGDTFVPYVFQVHDKATCQAIPNVPYDWIELQPTLAPMPPVDTRPEYEKNFKPLSKTMWVELGATVIDISNGKKTLFNINDNEPVDIGGETSVGSAKYYISKYWADKKVYNNVIPQAQLKDTPDPVVLPTPPIAPSPDQQSDDWGQQNNTLLKQILAILQTLLSKVTDIRSLFK